MTTPDAGTLATRLRTTRQERGLTQRILARRAGVSLSTITYLERGRTLAPTWSTVLALAAACAVDPCWLRGGEADGVAPTPLRLPQPGNVCASGAQRAG